MNVALLGTGLMGTPMAERLLHNNHRVFLYNRTQSKTKKLQEKGCLVAKDPQDAIAQAECIILILANIEAIEAVLFSNKNPAFADKTFIQMGTISPSESLELSRRIISLGGQYLECPVLGSRIEASESRLLLMVGASEENFNKWKAFLMAFGPEPRLIGSVGQAAALKLAMNQIIASHAAAFSLSLGIVSKNNVDLDTFMDILRKSALYAPMFDRKLPYWKNRKYQDPSFSTKMLLKDVDLIVKSAKEKQLSTAVIEEVRQLLAKAVDKDFGDQDYSSIYEMIQSSK